MWGGDTSVTIKMFEYFRKECDVRDEREAAGVSRWNEQSILIVIWQGTRENAQKFAREIQSAALPQGFQVEALFVSGASRAEAYEKAMRESDAKYKFYLDGTAQILNKNFIIESLRYFQKDPQAGMLALMGAPLPLEADMSACSHIWGMRGVRQEDGQVALLQGENPLVDHDVCLVDNGFLATSVDLPWDAAVDDRLLGSAQAISMHQEGKTVIVPRQNAPWFSFDGAGLFGEAATETWHGIYEAFLRTRGASVLPLVSVLIPTYNQPRFFREALGSALEQDYPRLEIVIGDDSTDTRTRDLMCPYLEKYPQIRYFYHGGPLGASGTNNINFLLAHARGEYLSFLFHDDRYYPGRIRKMMRYFLADDAHELALASSVRYCIDGQGRQRGILSPWVPYRDQVLTSELVGRKLLEGINFIGEMSTVLFRKEDIRIPGRQDRYQIECYCGVRDAANGDVATFLSLMQKHPRMVFLSEPLSAFRFHEAQNTWKLDIRMGSVFDWLDYIVLSWKHEQYIHTEQAYHRYLRMWYACFLPAFRQCQGREMTAAQKAEYQTLGKCFEAVAAGNYRELTRLSLRRMQQRGGKASA